MTAKDEIKINIRLSADSKRLIERAAKLQGISVSAWARHELRKAAQIEIAHDRKQKVEKAKKESLVRQDGVFKKLAKT